MPTSGPWRDSHSGEVVFLKTDYFRVARDPGAIPRGSPLIGCEESHFQVWSDNGLNWSMARPLWGLHGGAVVRRFSWVFGTALEDRYMAANVISNALAQRSSI